ncbi:hypothetical protein GCM10022280_16850 [Sphingomonas swuensis]|uniref:YcxB-like C-terminal domain-containing protein n=2 Tax=Sphingomonas swuensis TaxID=977800 RepID=A0ABP7SYB7_9SPHN
MLLLAIGAGSAYLFEGTRGVDLIYAALPYVLIWMVMVAAIYLLSPMWQVRQRRKSGWATPMKLRMNEAEIAIHHEVQSLQHRWAAIKRVVATRDRLFLFTTDSCAFILPRRAFASDAEFQRWSERAGAYWSDAHPAG